MKRIALFGGTFDPIHNGHIVLAREFAVRLGLDTVLLMPTYLPPHKLKASLTSSEDRLEMCRLAAEPYPFMEVSSLELSRKGASFTADTLATLAEQYPDAEWYLITGADMFVTLTTWNRFDEIARRAVLCAAPRGEIGMDALRQAAGKLEAAGARCRVEDIDAPTVSSTELRENAQRLEEYVPSAVARYIREHRLYETAAPQTDDQLIEIIRGRLGDKRFGHSMAVARRAKELAPLYGADANKAYTAGILHDIMKETPRERQLQMFEEFGILLSDVEKSSPALWHAMLGAAFAEKILGVTDRDLLNALRWHTTGRAGMSPLELTLFLADFTSEDRDYPDAPLMRRLSEQNADDALLYALDYTIGELTKARRAVHPDTLALYNEVSLRKGNGYGQR